MAMMGRLATFFAKNTADCVWNEGLKYIPGRKAFSNIVSQTCRDESAFQAKIAGPEKEPNLDMKRTSQNKLGLHSNESQKLEDVLRIFMTKEFVGRNMFGDLLIPEIRRGRTGTGEAISGMTRES